MALDRDDEILDVVLGLREVHLVPDDRVPGLLRAFRRPHLGLIGCLLQFVDRDAEILDSVLGLREVHLVPDDRVPGLLRAFRP